MEIQRQSEAFAYRLAAPPVSRHYSTKVLQGIHKTAADLVKDYTDNLYKEFHDWIDEQGAWPVGGHGPADYTKPMGGPLTYWDNIEGFFKDRYPAAYQGFTKAYEQAPLALDYNGYDTGPEAIAKHGYDPLEVAASMFYLHNQSDSARKELEKADEQRIIDVMRKRHEMSQGQNRSATKKLAKDIVLYRGFGLDFREPGMEKIKAITHPHFDAVPGESLVEAYDRSQKDEAEGVYDHPDLGPHILDYLSSGRGPGGYTLGSHWTPDISVAQDWSRHRGRTPVVLKVRIPGDTKKKTFNPGWKYEKEWPMPAGTPVNVEEVHLWNPRDVLWHNVLQEPSVRYANMDPILLAQKTIRVAENNLIDDDEWEIIDKINDHLSNGRPASAVAVWMQNMIPIYHLSRAPEIIHAYERMHPTGTNRTSQQFAEAQASAFDIDTFNAEVAPVLSDLAMQRHTRRVNESYRDNPDFDEDADDDYHDPRITPSNPYGDDEDDDYDDDDDEQGEKEEETDLDGGHYDEVGVFHPEFEHFQKLIDTPSDSRKLKSPWSHRVVHYTTNRPIPQELRGKPKDWDYTGDLYGDFEFGGPAFWDLKDPNYGVYQINHPRDEMHKPPVGYLQYHQTIDADDNPTIHIDYLDTHPNYRLQGVATALMNALAQDYPNHRIDPGFTTEHGTGFTNFMRENAPGAQDRLNTETWSPSSPNVVSDDQMKEWGVKKKKSPVFASLNTIRMAERILAFYEQDFYIPTKKELEEAEHPKSWRQLLKELFHPEDEDAIVKASKAIQKAHRVAWAGDGPVGIEEYPDLTSKERKALYQEILAQGGAPVLSNVYDPENWGSGDPRGIDDYRGYHRGPDADYGSSMDNPDGVFPDIDTHPEYYDTYQPYDYESHHQIRRVRGKPDSWVTVYRALPLSVLQHKTYRGGPNDLYEGSKPYSYRQREAPINTNDWVTPSYSYAQEHGETNLSNEPWTIVQQRVRARSLFSEGNSIHEWAYNGEPIVGTEGDRARRERGLRTRKTKRGNTIHCAPQVSRGYLRPT